MNSEFQTPESPPRNLRLVKDDRTERESNVFQSKILMDNNKIDTAEKPSSIDCKKTSSQKPDLSKWCGPMNNNEENDEDCEDLLCVVRQFCLEKPVTMAAMSYCHVKLC